MAYYCSTKMLQRDPSGRPYIEPERFGTPGEIVVPGPALPALNEMLAKITRRLRVRGIEVEAADLLAEEE